MAVSRQAPNRHPLRAVSTPTTTHELTGYASPPASRAPAPSRRGNREAIWFLSAVAAVTAAICLFGRGSLGSPLRAGQTALLFATCGSAGVLALQVRRPDTWRGTRIMAGALVASAAFQAIVWAMGVGLGPFGRGDVLAGAIGTLLAGALGLVVVDFGDHLRNGRIDIVSDVALVAALFGGIAYLAIGREIGVAISRQQAVLSAVIGFVAVLVLAGWSVLALWVPSRLHYGLGAGASLLAISGLWLDWSRSTHEMQATGPALAAAAAILWLTALLVVEPGVGRRRGSAPREHWWIRPSLLTVCLAGACITLGVAMTHKAHAGSLQTGLLLGLIAVLMAVRSFMSQGATARATNDLGQALQAREEALDTVRKAVDEVAASESRLRLLFDAAADGVVEINGRGVVARANGAFCEMVHLRADQVLGRSWTEVAVLVPGGAHMADLPTTGHAEVSVEGRTVYLEARPSPLPGEPPGTLLFVRDVTSTKVADQTIRTLFQFLQDRDEDRTRLLRRTNSTIESERNRVARDLHDGPIQGISAAALSLEAVKMMLTAGDAEKAENMLAEITTELSEEAENLRRLMSNLRPPLLDERGLVAAVRELGSKFAKDQGVKVSVDGQADQPMPEEVEVLAYRVVQEALTNVSKHAAAANVSVRIALSAGMLDVEVSDDGSGFDATKTRDYLRKGKVGLASMRERTELGGGTFTVRSQPGRGTTVSASLPYELLGASEARAVTDA